MPRDIRGHTWPNDGREWHIEDLLRGSGPYGAITFIHFQVLKDPWVHSAPSQDNRAIIGKILYGWPPQKIPAMPELLIHIRFYLEHFEDVPPLEWAGRVAHMLQNWQGSAWIDGAERQISLDLSTLPNIAVSIYNELNLSYEHKGLTQDECQSPDAYKRWAEAELAAFNELDRLLPNRKCLWVSSAPAPGHDAYPDDPDSEWAIIQATGLLDKVDLVGVHFYTEKNLRKPIDYKPESGPDGIDALWYSRRGERVVGYRENVQGKKGRPHDRGGVFRQFPQYRYFVTEWGTFACEVKERTDETIRDSEGMLRAFANTGVVVAATNFIWMAGDMHKPNVVWHNEQYRNWFANLQPIHTPAELPTAKWRWALPEPPAPEPEEPPMPDQPKPKYPVYEPGDLWGAIKNSANGLTQVSKEFSEWENGGAAYIYVKKASDGQVYKLFRFNNPDFQQLYLEGPIIPFK